MNMGSRIYKNLFEVKEELESDFDIISHTILRMLFDNHAIFHTKVTILPY